MYGLAAIPVNASTPVASGLPLPWSMLRPPLRAAFLVLVAVAAVHAMMGAAGGSSSSRTDGGGVLASTPGASDELRIDVVYPVAGAVIAATDSSFLLGSVGRGDARLTINGRPVPVASNGAWLGWLPLPPGPTMEFRLVAIAGRDTARHTLSVRRQVAFAEPADGPWIDTTSFQPSGDVWWPRDEPLPVSVRAREGARVSLVMGDGSRIALASAATAVAVPAGIRAFDRDTLNLGGPARRDRHYGLVRGRAAGLDPGAFLPGLPSGGGGEAVMVEAVLGRDTVRARWPLRLARIDSLPLAVEIHDSQAHDGLTDPSTPGRARPGATYHWFFPPGTQAEATARINGDVRLRLGPEDHAWVAAAELTPLKGDGGFGPAVAGSVTVTTDARQVRLRIPVSRQVPFFVDEEDRRVTLTLYQTAGDLNWIRYGSDRHPLLEVARWRQRGPNLELVLDLSLPAWGYRTRWVRGDLLLEIRRPPTINLEAPLRGRRIVVDAGHPPGGSTGPTRLTEAEANLAVARRLGTLLERAGATVIQTRRGEAPMELWPRIRLADSLSADLLISIHNNALPDGVNPFTNNGTTVFYNHPRSLPLARAVQGALVERLGLPDLGVARGDLAMARPTWMPAILVEGMFMIIPEQEAALRTPAGQARYAEGVAEGIRRFLLWHAGPARTSPR